MSMSWQAFLGSKLTGKFNSTSEYVLKYSNVSNMAHCVWITKRIEYKMRLVEEHFDELQVI